MSRNNRPQQAQWWYTPSEPCVLFKGVTGSLPVIILIFLTVCSLLLAGDLKCTQPTITMVNRSITQDQGAWVVDYRLRYTGQAGVVITSDDLAVRAEGWVSNSRVPAHALPRWSSLWVPRGPDLSAVCEVVTAPDEAERCRERLKISIETEDRPLLVTVPEVAPDAKLERQEAQPSKVAEPTVLVALSLSPGTILRVRLRFEHDHILYGEYDPLLSIRSVMLNIGSISVRDIIPLDREQYLAQPKFTWAEPPEDRRDTRHAVSGPDSLHLEAHIPGHQYYRYVERPVRYGTQMRLRFWYLIAAGTEGDCKVKVAQCKETPVAWRLLNSSLFEQCLRTVGRWTKVERIIQIEAEATKLTLEFTIVGDTEVGEMWVDDVSLEPVGSDGLGGP